jgi:hypothetical protein
VERFRFCLISNNFKISKYLMYRRVIHYYTFKFKWMLSSVPISRIYIICYVNQPSLAMLPKICR